MKAEEIMKSVIVQGTMMEVDTSFYENLLSDSDKLASDDTDLFSRIVTRIVRMCENGKMDPWNVDITSFAEALRGMLDENFTDFAQAGYVMLSAWHLLFRKSETVLFKASSMLESETDDVPLELTETSIPDPAELYLNVGPVFHPLEISSPVRHSETRKIMVLDVLVALKNAVTVQRSSYRREKEEIVITPAQVEQIVSELHSEEPEKEIEALLLKIMSRGAESFYMEEIWGDGDERRTFMVYSMFLAKRKQITLEQEFDFGPVLIRTGTGSTR